MCSSITLLPVPCSQVGIRSFDWGPSSWMDDLALAMLSVFNIDKDINRYIYMQSLFLNYLKLCPIILSVIQVSDIASSRDSERLCPLSRCFIHVGSGLLTSIDTYDSNVNANLN